MSIEVSVQDAVRVVNLIVIIATNSMATATEMLRIGSPRQALDKSASGKISCRQKKQVGDKELNVLNQSIHLNDFDSLKSGGWSQVSSDIQGDQLVPAGVKGEGKENTSGKKTQLNKQNNTDSSTCKVSKGKSLKKITFADVKERTQKSSQIIIPENQTTGVSCGKGRSTGEPKTSKSLNINEVCRYFDYTGSFDEIKAAFLQYSLGNKMQKGQCSDDLITVKRLKFTNCNCILKLFFKGSENAVYQLKVSSMSKSRAKLILAEGRESDFSVFAINFLNLLWNTNRLRINQGQSIDFFLLKHQNTILELKKYCIKLMEEALNCKEEENEEVKKQAENLVKKIKKELKNLKTGMAECQQISSNAYSNKKLEEAVLLSVKIYDLFEILYENQFKKLKQKRNAVHKAMRVGEIFQHLQIEQHYRLFKNRKAVKEVIKTEDVELEEYPYTAGVGMIEQLKEIDAPSTILQVLSIFNQKIRNSYNDYHINHVKVSDMDDHLPITIFCVLQCRTNVNLNTIVKLMQAYLNEEQQFQTEKKVLATVEAALDYIINEWNIETSIDTKLQN